MRRFLIVIERSKDGFGAYSPDLPGCVAVGKTRKVTKRIMWEAIALHLKGMKEDDIPIPEGRSTAEYIAVPEPAEA
jgi:predicted RNase H-like HicB family nuclease